jgi:hypothetical protein
MRARAAITAAALVAGLAVVAGPASPAHAAPAVKITKIYYNSPGTDTRSNSSLNAEYVVIKNVTTTTRSLSGWTLKDATGYTYTFGTFSLGAGKSVYVHTGKGTNTATHRYWQRAAYVWNNTGSDTGTLRTKAGTVIHRCSYTGTTAGYKICP